MQTKINVIDKEYIANGFANNVYLFKFKNKNYVYRETFGPPLNIKKIYAFFPLFKPFFTPNIIISTNAITYPFIEGNQLNLNLLSLKDEIRVFKKMGVVYRKIHNITHKRYLYKGNKFKSWSDLLNYKLDEICIPENKKYIKILKKIWRERFINYSPQKRLLHGDFSPKNIILHREKLKIIDWDKFIVGDKYFELTNILSKMFVRSHGNFEMSIITDAFFEAYGKKELNKLISTNDLYLFYSIYFLMEMYTRCIKSNSKIREKQYENRIIFLIFKLSSKNRTKFLKTGDKMTPNLNPGEIKILGHKK
ncbi:MAG: phosphotransferase [Candidatus ainarchaeum sp.]|nr:phosphotransferase [Candidatus ainarchaeum sp.]